MLATIFWENELDINGNFDPGNQFVIQFADNATVARAIVNRAIDDWERVIESFNYVADSDGDPNNNLDDTFTLSITASSAMQGFASAGNYEAEDPMNPGQPSSDGPASGIPMGAEITISFHPLNFGWYFDETPHDDVEFAGLVSEYGASFVDQAAFVDPDPNLQNRVYDFYYIVSHEIGHALGFAPSYKEFFDALDGRILKDAAGSPLATMASATGGHLDPSEHPNHVMSQPNVAFLGPNAGLPEPIGDPPETLRYFISDFEVEIFEEIYGYDVNLPSEFDTAHVMLDEITGTLLVQGAARDAAGNGLVDTIDIVKDGDDIKVTVTNANGTFVERTPSGRVTDIVIHGNGGADVITVNANVEQDSIEVDYVVSTNQDVLEAATVSGAASSVTVSSILATSYPATRRRSAQQLSRPTRERVHRRFMSDEAFMISRSRVLALTTQRSTTLT